jgi:hypothetical protein
VPEAVLLVNVRSCCPPSRTPTSTACAPSCRSRLSGAADDNTTFTSYWPTTYELYEVVPAVRRRY